MLIDTSPYKLIPEPAEAPPLPNRGGSFTDPSFDTRLVRITDESDGKLCRISYGIWAAFSCNYHRLLVQCDDHFKVFAFDPDHGIILGERTLPASFQGSDAIWSHSSPNKIFHRDGGSKLMLLNVDTMEDVVVHDFAPDFPDSPILTRMSSSTNDNVFCFARQKTNYEFSGFCVYTLNSGAIYREPPLREGQYFKVQIDKSGRWMWNVALDPTSEWWDLTKPNTQNARFTQGTGHSAVLTEKIVQYNNTSNMDLIGSFGEGGGLRTIVWPDWEIATEYSGTEADESWYTVTAGSKNPIGPLHDELLQVATDGSGTVRRICHMHNVMVDGDYDSIPQPATGYGAYPWIAFHSSWGRSGRRDVFLAKVDRDTSKPTFKPHIAGIGMRSFLELYGTGISGTDVTVSVGGLPATVTYRGLTQVNVAVPQSLVRTGPVDVVVTVDGSSSDKMRVVV